MQKYTTSFLGTDCPGVVACITRIFGENNCNIEAMSQTMLSGEFAAIFVVSAPDEIGLEQLKKLLTTGLTKAEIDLSVIVRPAREGQWGENIECEPFVVTADGPDGPGLIAAISRIFGQHGVNIENLTAILEDQAQFVFELMVPKNVDLGRLRRELAMEAQKVNLRISVQHRNIFEAVNRVSSF